MATAEHLERTKQRLNAYYDAEKAVLAGQSYRMGTKSLTRADLADIRETIDKLEGRVASLEASLNGRGKRVAVRIVPRDL